MRQPFVDLKFDSIGGPDFSKVASESVREQYLQTALAHFPNQNFRVLDLGQRAETTTAAIKSSTASMAASATKVDVKLPDAAPFAR